MVPKSVRYPRAQVFTAGKYVRVPGDAVRGFFDQAFRLLSEILAEILIPRTPGNTP